ncbi:MAG: divalent-cation tolerance protein CutA [Bacteroidia bacterium]
MEALTVYITCPDLACAQRIGRELVQQKLAACANILEGMHSIYWWEGELTEDREVVLLLKTQAGLAERLIEASKQIHPYEVPCIVAWPIAKANPEYLNWIAQETQA